MLKIAIDARWMSGQLRGMGRYAHQLIAPIKENLVYLQPKHSAPISNLSVCKGSGFFPRWEQFVLPKLCKQEQIDVLCCPYNTAPLFLRKPTKLVLVVHDLIFLKDRKQLPLSQSWYQNFGRFYRAFVVPRVVKRADYLVTVSHFTKTEMVDAFNIDPERVIVIPNSIDQAWLNLDLLSLSQRGDYFFTVAGDAPSKNIPRLIEAFALFTRDKLCGTRLKIAGIKTTSQQVFIDLAKAFDVFDQIDFLDYLSTEDLQSLYLKAKGFVFASTFEGFGIPLLEAMSCCVPIACSNTTSLPEVVGEYGVLFDPYSPASIAEGLGKLTNDSLWSDAKVLAAKQRVVNLYSQEVICQQFEKFWSDVRGR